MVKNVSQRGDDCQRNVQDDFLDMRLAQSWGTGKVNRVGQEHKET